MNDEKITVLVVEPQKEPYKKEITNDLASLQKEVGGYIQAVYPFDEPAAIICNDEGKLNGAELNRALRDDEGHIYDIVAGTFLIAGLSEDNFSSLSKEHIEKFRNQFETPELFVQFGGRTMVIPIETPKQKEHKPSVLNKLHDAEPKAQDKPLKNNKEAEL